MTTITLIVLALSALAAIGSCLVASSRTEARIEVMLATTPKCQRCGAYVCDGECRCRRSAALARY